MQCFFLISYNTPISDDRLDELLIGSDPILNKKEQAYLETLDDPVSDMIVSLMWRYLPIPLSSLSIVPDIDESPYKYMSEKDPSFNRAIDRFTRDFCKMPIVDYFAFLKDRIHRPVFQVSSIYYTLEESKVLIKNWFKFQFGDKWLDVLGETYAIVSAKRLKKCTLWFVGPPNSGKTFVTQSLANLFVLSGQIKNLIAKGQFPTKYSS